MKNNPSTKRFTDQNVKLWTQGIDKNQSTLFLQNRQKLEVIIPSVNSQSNKAKRRIPKLVTYSLCNK